MFGEVDEFNIYVGSAKQVNSVGKAVFLAIDYAADARLDDELGALQTG